MDKTIIYYTSNREDPKFEKKIIKNLLFQAGNLPIISVSQKPMDLGKNICVGIKDISYINEWRQIIIGAKAAKTEYIITAESDFLYVPEYFNFEPKGEDVYRYDNIWIMWLFETERKNKYDNFYRKYYSEGAQIVKRKYFIKLIENYLKPFPKYYYGSYKRLKSGESPYANQPYNFIHGKTPCVSVKTGNDVSKYTLTMRGEKNIARKLRYWGDLDKLRKKLL